MGRSEEIAELLRNGMTIHEIQQKTRLNLTSVLDYLSRGTGKYPRNNPLSRAEILDSVAPDRLAILTKEIQKDSAIYPNVLWKSLAKSGAWQDYLEFQADFQVVKLHGDLSVDPHGRPGSVLGYTFEVIWTIERYLSVRLEQRLESVYGERWWQDQVPEKLRRKEFRALNSLRDANLLDIMKIATEFWSVVGPQLGEYSAGLAHVFRKDIEGLNDVRNRLFHPAKMMTISHEDYLLAKTVRKKLLGH